MKRLLRVFVVFGFALIIQGCAIYPYRYSAYNGYGPYYRYQPYGYQSYVYQPYVYRSYVYRPYRNFGWWGGHHWGYGYNRGFEWGEHHGWRGRR